MSTHDVQVVIVGAGIAGLKAAQDLQAAGVDFLVLEGRDRVGGRLHSVDFQGGKHKVDLGASWFHDTLCNELFTEIQQEGSYNLYYDDSTPILVTETGVLQNDKLKVQQVVDEMIKFIELQYFDNLDQKDISLRAKSVDYLFKQKELLTDEQIQYAPQLLRYLELWHGVGWDSMSSKYAMVDNVGRNCLITDGYSSIVEKMLQSIPSESIHLSAVVNEIARQSDGHIAVSTTDGDRFSCQYCIVTVPQSILKLDKTETAGIKWEPPLPPRILNALDKMHFGSLGKFIFEFDEIFWDEDSTDRFFALATPNTDILNQLRNGIKPKIPEFIPESASSPDTWDHPVLILNLSTSYGVPALLVFTQGALTYHLERNLDEAWNHFEPIFAKISKTHEAPNPSNIIGSSWTIDPFSRGSYAACHPGDDPTDLIIQLTKGLDNVRFAGEHTILDGAGAVHGAWMSGRREANHILIKLGLKEGTIDIY